MRWPGLWDAQLRAEGDDIGHVQAGVADKTRALVEVRGFELRESQPDTSYAEPLPHCEVLVQALPVGADRADRDARVHQPTDVGRAAVLPPSTGMTIPVTPADSLLANQRQAFATSVAVTGAVSCAAPM